MGGGSATGGGSAMGGGSSTGGGNSDAGVLTGATMGQLIGVNANIASRVQDLLPFGTVREYHNWGWLADNFASGPAYPAMQYTFAAFNGWDWDDFYTRLRDGGTEPFPAVQGSVPWENSSAIPPIASGADKLAAASYVAHGDTMFQLAARYGSVHVADNALKVKANGQPRASGLGLLNYYENFNEQDNAAGFTGDAFAAMSSADYDGDEGRLGATIGIKNADPNAKLVMGGLSGRYPTSTNWVPSITTFLDAMRTWSAAHRDAGFPADVINVHLYSFGPGTGQPIAPAIAPEPDGVEAKLDAIKQYRDQHLPGKELWWTEFGYDTDPTSNLHAPALGSDSAEVVQGAWLVRDFLIAAKLGYDRATLFEIYDTCVPGQSGCNASQQFTTCGVMTADAPPRAKAAWYFLSTVRSRMRDLVFVREESTGDANVRVMTFRDRSSLNGARVVWMPTSAGMTRAGYSLDVGAATTATAVKLVDQQPNGTASTITVAGGHAAVDISETPLIVLVDAL
jgi:hypothetical protein